MNTPDKDLTIKEAGALLGFGQNELFELLRKNKVLTKQNAAKPKYQQLGYFKNELKQYQHPTIGAQLYTQVHVTPTGIRWLKQQLEKQSCQQQ
jgi:phage antirepressor YoqD-like protein